MTSSEPKVAVIVVFAAAVVVDVVGNQTLDHNGRSHLFVIFHRL